MSRGRRRFAAFALVATVLAVVVLLCSPLRGADAEPVATVVNPQHEYNVKAAFLYSFGRYVEWPSGVFQNSEAPFVIGVLGEDPFGGALDRIAQSKRIQQRPIVVHRMTSMDDYRPCHILFVPRTTSPEEQAAAIKRLGRLPVLLVGDEAPFARGGGTVGFYVDEDTVRFEINVATVRQQRLTVDAKLLKLATIVQDPED